MRESEATRKFLEVVGDTIRIRRLTRLSTLLAFHLDSTRFCRISRQIGARTSLSAVGYEFYHRLLLPELKVRVASVMPSLY